MGVTLRISIAGFSQMLGVNSQMLGVTGAVDNPDVYKRQGLASGTASNATSHSAYTSRLSTAPIVPNIWEEPAVGVLRVTPINPAVPGLSLIHISEPTRPY